ncbi:MULTISPECIES: amidohydrolase family protein [unclassified Mesorhizobium]|uniref:amidohydrolase family protein n=1 Tax=unclassified Mesorhizobium TaxID=325217 RepID=UPI00112A0A9D|nr:MULTISPECIES: amidohydrolase family protein [unclassified Mesorhizobium]MBZ9983571.1 amidohydrolase family protein [Mesorhizobium sp. BR-1-1-8]TPL27429.1 amidohydrolase family protein [Mesorhizobium sp. B2-4-8]TPL59420.1 amidohydrolase family protein [Mesorhizobium sp. B2-4-1]
MSHSRRTNQRDDGPVLLTARWVVGHRDGRHVLLENGEVVHENGRIVLVGHRYGGPVKRRIDHGRALIGPGFIDLDALSDLDTGVLGLDHQPGWKKGRVWPRDYVEAGPVEMLAREELAFQKHYAFAQLIRNGITTALLIASLFYRAWNETSDEFASAAESAAELGLRVYLGPAFRAGHSVIEVDGGIVVEVDEERGAEGLDDAVAFCLEHEGRFGGLVRTMLAPDRVEFWTADLLRRTANAARDLGVPVRLHCCQSSFEIETVRRRFGTTSARWLQDIRFLSERALLPHGTHADGDDLEIIAGSGATLVHCPLVMARHGAALDNFARLRGQGLRIGMGTDTWPPDMVQNMQVGLMLGRVMAGNLETPKSADLYDAATIGGADALGRSDLGRLQAGAAADIVVFDLSGNHLGQVLDPIACLTTSAGGRDVHTVIIDGRTVMSARTIPGFDLDAAHQRAQAQFERLVQRYPQRTWRHPTVAEIFPPSYRMFMA